MTFDFKVDRKKKDLELSDDGDLQVVTGLDKMEQELQKIFLTDIRTNYFHPTFGSLLISQLGQPLSEEKIEAFIEQEVLTRINTLQQNQQQQMEVYDLSAEEIISRVISVISEKDKTDPRRYLVNVQLVALSGETLTVPLVVRV